MQDVSGENETSQCGDSNIISIDHEISWVPPIVTDGISCISCLNNQHVFTDGSFDDKKKCNASYGYTIKECGNDFHTSGSIIDSVKILPPQYYGGKRFDGQMCELFAQICVAGIPRLLYPYMSVMDSLYTFLTIIDTRIRFNNSCPNSHNCMNHYEYTRTCSFCNCDTIHGIGCDQCTYCVCTKCASLVYGTNDVEFRSFKVANCMIIKRLQDIIKVTISGTKMNLAKWWSIANNEKWNDSASSSLACETLLANIHFLKTKSHTNVIKTDLGKKIEYEEPVVVYPNFFISKGNMTVDSVIQIKNEDSHLHDEIFFPRTDFNFVPIYKSSVITGEVNKFVKNVLRDAFENAWKNNDNRKVMAKILLMDKTYDCETLNINSYRKSHIDKTYQKALNYMKFDDEYWVDCSVFIFKLREGSAGSWVHYFYRHNGVWQIPYKMEFRMYLNCPLCFGLSNNDLGYFPHYIHQCRNATIDNMMNVLRNKVEFH